MFPGDRSFNKQRYIKVLFVTVNNELQSFREWFISNRLSFNGENPKYEKIAKKD